MEVSEVKAFTPTMDEFKNFSKYIEYLESIDAHKLGVVKVKPPKEWKPRASGYEINSLNYKIKKPLLQTFKKGNTSGAYQMNGIVKTQTTAKEYKRLANKEKYRTPDHLSFTDIEKKYWSSLEGASSVSPVYGCDVDGSVTDKDQKYWNTQKLKTILDEVDIDVKGVNKPYVYFGMWKSSFGWHVEDMDLYSINYLHHGMPKTWYVVAPCNGHLLEKAAREIFPNIASWCTNFMRHKTCVISPDVLEKFKIPYQKVVQEENNAIIVFPYAYHSGFNHGFNIAEAVNFATKRWIEYGKRAKQCDCQSSKARVILDMKEFVKKYQPHKYRLWKSGLDIAPHPEDPPHLKDEHQHREKSVKSYIKMKRKQLVDLNETIKRVKENDIIFSDKMRSIEQPFDMDKNSKMKIYDLYQHHEYFNVKIAVDSKSMKIHPKGQIVLAKFSLDKIGLSTLITEGIMIKVGEKTTIIKEENGWIWEMEFVEKLVHVYKHINLDIEAVVDPESLELFGTQLPELTHFLKHQSITEYIAKGDFCYKKDDRRGCLLKL